LVFLNELFFKSISFNVAMLSPYHGSIISLFAP
jgi:hypothetical protein